MDFHLFRYLTIPCSKVIYLGRMFKSSFSHFFFFIKIFWCGWLWYFSESWNYCAKFKGRRQLWPSKLTKILLPLSSYQKLVHNLNDYLLQLIQDYIRYRLKLSLSFCVNYWLLMIAVWTYETEGFVDTFSVSSLGFDSWLYLCQSRRKISYLWSYNSRSSFQPLRDLDWRAPPS